MKIALCGYGYVGKAQLKLIANDKDEYYIYDPAQGFDDKEKVNQSDIAFIAVPTPMEDSGQCNTSIVEDIASWIETPLVIIQSTIEIGTTDNLNYNYGDRFVFQPEFFGETVGHPMMDKNNRTFIILGGPDHLTEEAAEFYHSVYNSTVHIARTNARTAELCKYMENAFIAIKVTFVNEMYEIAQAMDVNFHDLRELWLLDPRVSRYFSFVHKKDRGFGGKCLPKDVNALVYKAREEGYEAEFLKEVLKSNERFRK